MSRRHPERPDGVMGRPPRVLGQNAALKAWKPYRRGRRPGRLSLLYERVDAMYYRGRPSAEVLVAVPPLATASCPRCGNTYHCFTHKRTPRSNLRKLICDHATKKHGDLTRREVSLLADLALERAT